MFDFQRLAVGLLGGAMLVAAGCSGDLGPTTQPESAQPPQVDPGSSTVGGPGAGTAAAGPAAVPAPSDQLVSGGALRRLSVRSLHATLDTLFPELAQQRPEYPPDVFQMFDTELTLDNGLAFVETTSLVMSDVVELIRQNPTAWARIRSCAPTADTASCLGEFYDTWAPRLLRRPAIPEERAEYVGLASQDLGDTDEVLAMALEAMLRHPEFTHRVELGQGSGPQRFLAQHELQSRLAFFLWGEAPDDTLRAMSPPNLLDQTARVGLAEQMLADPRAQRQVRDYHAQWIGFATMPRDGLKQDMWEESAALIQRVVFEGIPYQQLFLSEESYLTPELAEHYELPPIDEPGWTAVGGSGRLGIFGHGAFLQAFSNVADTSPVKRGKNILGRFLCRHIELPENMDVDVDAQPEEDQCRVEFFRDVHAQGACAGCHKILDGVGFALEVFDKTGKPRTHEQDAPDCPLDGQGELEGVAFEGVEGLAQQIAQHPALDACITNQLAHFVLGQQPEKSSAGKAWVQSLTQSYIDSGGQFQELLLDMVSRPEFAQIAPE